MSSNELRYSVAETPLGGIRVILAGVGVQREIYAGRSVVHQVFPAGRVDAECYAFNAMVKACAYPVTGLIYV